MGCLWELTCLNDVEVVRVCGEGAVISVDDGAEDCGLGDRGGYLLSQLVEAGVVLVPPHVPEQPSPRLRSGNNFPDLLLISS